MNVTRNEALGMGLIFGSLVSTCYAIKVTCDLRRVERKLDKTVAEIVDKDIDISEELVKTSVEKAAKDAARYEVEKAMRDAANDIVEGFKASITNAVEDEFKVQKSSVAKTLKSKIEDIDIREIKREVVREAKEECAKKLKKDLDEISDKYTEQIKSMSSIYSTIASKIESIGE